MQATFFFLVCTYVKGDLSGWVCVHLRLRLAGWLAKTEMLQRVHACVKFGLRLKPADAAIFNIRLVLQGRSLPDQARAARQNQAGKSI